MMLIDVSEWTLDEQNAVFPVGARDKQMLWSPEEAPEGLKPSWPYLFKESIARYPDQYWTEVVAYIVSKYIDVKVPKAVPAFRLEDGEIIEGSLIEWFYDVHNERYMPGGVFFKRRIPEFDDELGQHHNFKDFATILRALKLNSKTPLQDDIGLWVADMAFFDSLIGNTDRHQENWGVIFRDEHSLMAPLFDNGTSLGHERFVAHIANWNEQQYTNYLAKGKHHLRYTRDNLTLRIPHDVLIGVIASRPKSRAHILNKIEKLEQNWANLLAELLDLTTIQSQTPMCIDRHNWMVNLLVRRFEKIKEAVK